MSHFSRTHRIYEIRLNIFRGTGHLVLAGGASSHGATGRGRGSWGIWAPVGSTFLLGVVGAATRGRAFWVLLGSGGFHFSSWGCWGGIPGSALTDKYVSTKWDLIQERLLVEYWHDDWIV
jgi:hypothetical protein